MVLSALLLFCCTALPVDTPRAVADSPTLVASNSNSSEPDSTTKSKLPDAPTPKLTPAGNGDVDVSSPVVEGSTPGGSLLNSPIKPAAIHPVESPRQRKIWYALMVSGHSAAAFDAWSTRRALSGGYGTEGDPLLRPFAHSGAIYAATQVSPAIMDYLGHRMMVSKNGLFRRFWWLPQAAGASFSFGAGLHNYYVVP